MAYLCTLSKPLELTKLQEPKRDNHWYKKPPMQDSSQIGVGRIDWIAGPDNKVENLEGLQAWTFDL